jgi:hypothetical protein
MRLLFTPKFTVAQIGSEKPIFAKDIFVKNGAPERLLIPSYE